MLSPFLLSAVQRRLITTPAEASNLPPSAPPPPSLGLKTLSPLCLTPFGAMCMVNLAVWPRLGLSRQLLLVLPIPGRI